MPNRYGVSTQLCDYCGKLYTQTNLMFRREPILQDSDGKAMVDTHQISCAKRLGKFTNTPWQRGRRVA